MVEQSEEEADEEADEANALAQVVDGEDDEASIDDEADFQDGQDVGKIPTPSKAVVESTKSSGAEPGVVYIGRKLLSHPPIISLRAAR